MTTYIQTDKVGKACNITTGKRLSFLSKVSQEPVNHATSPLTFTRLACVIAKELLI